MGLDIVELFMAVEERSGLEIPNREAQRLTTVGQMHEYVLTALRTRGARVDEAQLYGELRPVICERTGVQPEAVVPEASFVDDLRLD
jgi:acyl carrier protein